MNFKLNNHIRKFLDRIVLAGMILPLCYGMSGSTAAQVQKAWTEPPAESGVPQEATAVPLGASFTLDGVIVSVRASSLPSVDFVVSEPGSIIQVATSVAWKPYREFSITAIPFGSKPGTEALPAAGVGLKPTYDSAIRIYRLQKGSQVQDGSTISVFGQQIIGLHSLDNIYLDGVVPKPVVIEDWVVEAGNRLWIIRSSAEESTSGASMQSENSLGDLEIDSSTLNNPSTIHVQPAQSSAMDSNQVGKAADLPTPSWWSGDCDNNNYIKKSGGIASYRLGAVYLGLPACGPRPAFDSAPDVEVRFFTGSWGEYEWECVELSMRFLYLMYGITPYSANGNQVVPNYSGNQLIKIPNGTIGQAPAPNDVLSYGPDKTYGHTSVVTASNVDGNGNGTITVIEQNNTVSGSSNLNVSGWVVAGNAGSVSGWLQSNTLPLTLSVVKAGTGIGTVTSSPVGINCGSTCSAPFGYSTSVTLTAAPSTGSFFTGWSGSGCTSTGTCMVTMDAAKLVTATFTLANTFTPTSTPTFTPTSTFTPTFSPTSTPTRTSTPTSTPSKTFTPSSTPTKTQTPTITRTPTRTFTSTRTMTLTATPAPPGAFNKTSPANAATNQLTSPSLKWGAALTATRYDYCYDTTNDNVCSIWTSNGTATSKALSGLKPYTTYYWQVRAVNSFGTTYANGGTWWTFKTAPLTASFQSVGTYDGWVRESSAGSGVGGSLDATSQYLRLGDDALNRQYRAMLSFDTTNLPDTAVITQVALKVIQYSIAGTTPFTVMGALNVDIRKPSFGTTVGLVASDFQATASKAGAGTFGATPVSGWYTTNLGSTANPYVNLSGTTQFRLRFALASNNNSTDDYINIYSGNATTAANRPILIIKYYVP